jgi:hypothetical protein
MNPLGFWVWGLLSGYFEDEDDDEDDSKRGIVLVLVLLLVLEFNLLKRS